MAHILVVDDDPDIRDILEISLTMAGHEVSTAPDGLAAVEAMHERRPMIALLDVTMPRMSGHDVVRTVRSTPELADLPILMLSALGNRDDVAAGLAAGANEYAVKPFDISELFTRVDRLLGASRAVAA